MVDIATAAVEEEGDTSWPWTAERARAISPGQSAEEPGAAATNDVHMQGVVDQERAHPAFGVTHLQHQDLRVNGAGGADGVSVGAAPEELGAVLHAEEAVEGEIAL